MVENLHVFYCFFLWNDISNDVIIWNQMAVKYAKAHVLLLYLPPKEGCYSVSPWTQNFLIPSFENIFPLRMFATLFFFVTPYQIIVKPINLLTWIFCLSLSILVLVGIGNCFHLVNDWMAKQLRMPFMLLLHNFLVVLSIWHGLQWGQQLSGLLEGSFSIILLSCTEKGCFALVLQIMRKDHKVLIHTNFFFLL